MSLLRLAACVLGVYAMFLLWAIAQERLSVPFESTISPKPERFHFSLFMNTCQSFASVISSLVYIYIRRPPNSTLRQYLGLELSQPKPLQNGNGHANGSTKPSSNTKPKAPPQTIRTLFLRYLQCSLLVTFAAPFGFAALSHISYPTMVLAKSCKLVPVMLMNVLLYRRKFAPHKYLVVALVTIGITMFMGFGNAGPSKKGKDSKGSAGGSVYGLVLLLINLAMDGATNSTQDEIFSRYKVTGQQMMFWLNLFGTVITTALITLPLPYIPIIHESTTGRSEFLDAIQFLRTHPSVVKPIVQFAFTGALGQLFIFETLQHFGSLTLVTITLTRKLFTMILSVIVYKHKLTLGQWSGAAVVFAGIGVEAWVKRKDVHAKRVLAEKEKAKIKDL